MAKKAKISVDEFYSQIYGIRWPRLKQALLDEVLEQSKFARFVGLDYRDPFSIDDCESQNAEYQESDPYFLDYASFVCAYCLPFNSGTRDVLDMCSSRRKSSYLKATARETQL